MLADEMLTTGRWIGALRRGRGEREEGPQPEGRARASARSVETHAGSPWAARGRPRGSRPPRTRHESVSEQASPERGEHTDAILAELGYDAAAIGKLRAAKAV